MHRLTNKGKWAAAVLLSATLLCTTVNAFAAPISSDINIEGSVSFDTANSFGIIGQGSHTGEIVGVFGGSTQTTDIDNASVSGNNPITGDLTQTGDALSVATTLQGSSNAEADGIFFDFGLEFENTSLTDTYQLFFELVFQTSTSASGQDSFAESEVNLFNDANDEFFFSDLTTDTINGDEVNGDLTGNAGESLTDTGLFAFDYTLDANTSNFFTGFVKLDGGEFFGRGTFGSSASVALRLTNVVNLNVVQPPLPQASAPLTTSIFALGMLGLLGLRKRKQA